ncbi:MAG TPA: hypothetical protein VGK93_09800 [Candidatus Eisenbacteria bacterium]
MIGIPKEEEWTPMYIIRESFVAKPGMASKLAQLFKEAAPSLFGSKTRVMTDAVAAFNTVVIETEVSELAEFERIMKEYGERKEIRDRFKGYTDLWISGGREIYRVV